MHTKEITTATAKQCKQIIQPFNCRIKALPETKATIVADKYAHKFQFLTG
jgi:hypothetical protein